MKLVTSQVTWNSVTLTPELRLTITVPGEVFHNGNLVSHPPEVTYDNLLVGFESIAQDLVQLRVKATVTKDERQKVADDAAVVE